MNKGFFQTTSALARAVFYCAAGLTALQLSCGWALEIYAAMRGVPSDQLSMGIIRLDDEGGLHGVSSALVILVLGIFTLRTGVRELANRRGIAVGWFCLGVIFLVMALDDSLSLHELLNRLGSIPQIGPLFQFRWVIVGLTVGAFLAAAFVPFLFRVTRITAIRLAVAGAIFVIASMGLEMAGSAIALYYGRESVGWTIEFVIEESFEDFAMLLALRAVLLHCYEILPVLIASRRAQRSPDTEAENAS